MNVYEFENRIRCLAKDVRMIRKDEYSAGNPECQIKALSMIRSTTSCTRKSCLSVGRVNTSTSSLRISQAIMEWIKGCVDSLSMVTIKGAVTHSMAAKIAQLTKIPSQFDYRTFRSQFHPAFAVFKHSFVPPSQTRIIRFISGITMQFLHIDQSLFRSVKGMTTSTLTMSPIFCRGVPTSIFLPFCQQLTRAMLNCSNYPIMREMNLRAKNTSRTEVTSSQIWQLPAKRRLDPKQHSQLTVVSNDDPSI